MAAVGDIGRFPSARQLVSYLRLDPRVRQSGNSPARHGRISKAGASEARHMLGEAAWRVILTAGPLRAFFERVRARRGPQVAATATTRGAVLAPARGPGGLRVRPAGDDAKRHPQARTARRRPGAEGPPRNRGR
jgi:transposase